MKYLNVAFNSSNIFFKYTGYQEVQNNQLSNFTESWQITSNVNPSGNDIAQYRHIDAMNLVFLDYFTNPNPLLNDFAYQEHAFMSYNMSVFQLGLLNDPILEQTIVHKLGHNLGLYETCRTGNNFSTQDPLFTIAQCERITRDTEDLNFNADIAGDELIDTAAQPIVYDSFFVNNCGEYNFSPTRINCFDEPYVNINNGNWMNRIDVPTSCLHYFTPGQTKKMRKFILNDNYTYAYFGNQHIPLTRNTVQSLYQPYERIQLVNNILSTTDNGDGTAKVCRGYTEQFKFQKGFDYQFPENQSPDLTEYTTNELPFISRPAFNCPITIMQLAPGQTNLPSNSGYAETVCRGQVCIDEELVQGTIISTAILGSMNITVEQLNEMQIKDPELYNNFLSHYYYIVKKQTLSGAKTEQVFYKP
jgi:hypothetical protein